MENTIEQIKSSVDALNLQNIPLMEKPSEDELKYLRIGIEKGKYIKTYTYSYEGPIYWCYPNNVKEKIEDDKTYKVWFNFKHTVDICNSTTCRNIKYIEEVPENKLN